MKHHTVKTYAINEYRSVFLVQDEHLLPILTEDSIDILQFTKKSTVSAIFITCSVIKIVDRDINRNHMRVLAGLGQIK